MGVALNCPECGARLDVTGLTPNRMVHCQSCEQWVKIPVLPRAARKRGMPGQWPGSGPAPPDWTKIGAIGGASLIAVLLVILIVLLVGRGRERRMHQREVARLTDEATQEENQKNYGAAVGRIDAALAEAATIQPRDDAMPRRSSRSASDWSETSARSLTTAAARSARRPTRSSPRSSRNGA